MGKSRAVTAERELPVAVRYIVAVVGSVIWFIVVGVVLMYNSYLTIPILKYLMPAGMLVLGALWGFNRLPWYLSFIPPCGIFVMFCFTRLDGAESLEYLTGYVPICLAGSLVVTSLVNHFREKKKETAGDDILNSGA